MDQLTETKIKRLTSKGAWEIYENDEDNNFSFTDGPSGVRKVKEEKDGYQISFENNCYPCSSALASTWNEEVVKKIGTCIGEDTKLAGANVILGPGVNIKRTPLCGRNFEYYSEDPLLAGTLAKNYIEGVQSTGVGACLKHFAVNNREYDRFYQSSEVDERTLNEIYLTAFKIALKANPWSVMCSYNPVNGILASENKFLLTDTLRNKFNYKGLIISDWGSVRNRAKSLIAGIDIAFPYDGNFYSQVEENYYSHELKDYVENANRRIDEIKEKGREGLKINNKLSQQDKDNIILDAGLESVVLLKNEDNILPLKPNNKVLVLGEMCEFPPISGGGSADVTPKYQPKSLKNCLIAEGVDETNIQYSKAYMLRYKLPTPFGYKVSLEQTYGKDVVIIGVGHNVLEEKEETDRVSLKLNKVYEDLIIKAANYNPNVVVLLYVASPVDVSNFKDKVKAIVYVNYLGQRANECLAKLLLNKVSFSGRLAETWPLCLADTPTNNEVGNSFAETYNEGVLVGYRYYDTLKKEVAYPFGYGLSEFKTSLSNLKVQKLEETKYIVTLTVTNVGDFDAFETIQLYVKDVFSSVIRPEQELKGFVKTKIPHGESKEISFMLDETSFNFYNINFHNYYVENGVYEIRIGKSSRDIQLKTTIEIKLDDFTQYSRS